MFREPAVDRTAALSIDAVARPRAGLLVSIAALLATALQPAANAITGPSYRGLTVDERAVAVAPMLGGAAVNTLTGNLVVRRRILTVPGRGIPLEIELTYNADRGPITSPFGMGWNLSYNVRYVTDPAGNVRIIWGDGRVDLFSAAGGGFTSPPGVYLTLTQPVAGQYLLRSARGLELRFADATHRRLTSITDPNGNALALAYDAARRLTQITIPGGRVYTLTYDALGRLSSLADPNLGGRQWAFAYDAASRLIQIADPTGEPESYSYDAENLLTGITDRRGNTVTVTYMTPAGSPGTRLAAGVEKGGSSVALAWDTVDRRTAITDPNGNVWTHTYDGQDRLVRVADPLANEEQLAWDAGRNVVSRTDRNGHTTTAAYDGRGNLTRLEVPVDAGASIVNEWTYEPGLSRVTSHLDGRGNTTTYAYDARGNLVSVTDPAPLGTSETRLVDAAGQITSMTDRSGRVATYGYDAHGNLTGVTNGVGSVWQYEYDGASRLIRVRDPLLNEVTVAYDARDRMTATTDALGNPDGFLWDAGGLLTRYTDRDGNQTQYAYDALGRLTQVTDGLGNSDERTYDASGNLVTYHDRGGNAWLRGYDAANRLTSRTNPLGRTWAYTYDAAGNLASQTDPKGQTLAFVYDFAGRMVREDLPDGTRSDFGYDPGSNLVTAQKRIVASGVLTTDYAYTYDAADRRTVFNDLRRGKTITTAYDGEGRMTSVAGPDAALTAYTHDAAGRLTTVSAFGLTTTYTYDAAGNLVAQHSPGDFGHTLAYDSNNRLISRVLQAGVPAAVQMLSNGGPLAIGNVIASFLYNLNKVGEIEMTTRETGQERVISRNGNQRPTVEIVTSPAITITVAYDSNGNLSRYFRNASGSTFDRTIEVNSVGRPYRFIDILGGSSVITSTLQLDQIGNTTVISTTSGGPPSVGAFGYDPHNNLAASPTASYFYDAYNQLLSRQKGSSKVELTVDQSRVVKVEGAPAPGNSELPVEGVYPPPGPTPSPGAPSGMAYQPADPNQQQRLSEFFGDVVLFTDSAFGNEVYLAGGNAPARLDGSGPTTYAVANAANGMVLYRQDFDGMHFLNSSSGFVLPEFIRTYYHPQVPYALDGFGIDLEDGLFVSTGVLAPFNAGLAGASGVGVENNLELFPFNADAIVVNLQQGGAIYLPVIQKGAPQTWQAPAPMLAVSHRRTGGLPTFQAPETGPHPTRDAWSGCQSCHFNGLSDGTVWTFEAGPRRTGPSPTQRILNYTAIFDEVDDFERNIRGVHNTVDDLFKR